jgi:hypothetical protein
MSTRTFLAAALFAAAIRSPALAQQVPQALERNKPHEIVEAVISEARPLSLSVDQVKGLDDLHVSVRDPEHMMMEPMITKRGAYNDALSYLTPDRQARAAARFRDPAYRSPTKDAAKS